MSKTPKKETEDFFNDSATLIEFCSTRLEFYKITEKEDEKYLLFDSITKSFEICNARSLSASLLMKTSAAKIKFLCLKRKDMIDLLIENNLIKEIYSIGYRPASENIYESQGKTFFNSFKFSEIENQIFLKNDFKVKIPIEEGITKYSFPWIHKLCSHLVGIWEPNLEYSNNKNKLLKEWEEKLFYFYKWLSFIEQNPTQKLKTSIIMQGTQSTGKGLFQALMVLLFGRDNITYISQKVLEGKFSDFLKGKRFVFANEIHFNFKSSTYENLKMYSSDKYINVEGKNKDVYAIENYCHFIFYTNQENPLRIENNDTRHTVFYQENSIPDEIVENLHTTKNIEYVKEELNEFLKFLLHIEVDFDEVKIPLETKEKEAIKEFHKDDITRFIEWCQNCGSLKSAVKELNLRTDELAYINSSFYEDGISNAKLFHLYSWFCRDKKIKLLRQQESFLQGLRGYNFTTKSQWDKDLKKTIKIKLIDEIFFNLDKYIYDNLKKYNFIELDEINSLIEKNKFLSNKNCYGIIDDLIQANIISIKENRIIFSKNYLEENSKEILDLSSEQIIQKEVKE